MQGLVEKNIHIYYSRVLLWKLLCLQSNDYLPGLQQEVVSAMWHGMGKYSFILPYMPSHMEAVRFRVGIKNAQINYNGKTFLRETDGFNYTKGKGKKSKKHCNSCLHTN